MQNLQMLDSRKRVATGLMPVVNLAIYLTDGKKQVEIRFKKIV